MDYSHKLKVFLNKQKPHLMRLNETELDENVIDDDLFIDGYNIVRRNRNRHSGGVAIYVSDEEFLRN